MAAASPSRARRERTAHGAAPRAPRVFLSLGSNIGDREINLRRAIAGLSGLFEELRVSSLYETEPMYVTNQPRFLNIVAAGPCSLPPPALLDRIHAIEAQLGRDRRREQVKGPRTIDIDILLYGDLIVDTASLQIPHPGLRERQFVLVPLLEIDPATRDPRTGEAYARLSEALRAASAPGVYIFGPWAYTEPPGET